MRLVSCLLWRCWLAEIHDIGGNEVLMMKNIDKIRAMSAEELAKWKRSRRCFNNCRFEQTCDMACKGLIEWLYQEINPMPEIKIGDVLDVVLEDDAWYDGVYVAKGIVYILGECICKEITEVKIKSVSRWSSGSMHEIWRADDE